MPTNIGSHLDIQSDRIAHVKAEDVMRLSKYCVKTGDIIYSRRGDIEKCAFIRPQEEGWLCGTGCLRIRTNSQKANSHFIAYQLSTKECKKWIVGNAVGTTMLNLNSGILKELPLYMPNRQIQDSVVAILKSLDDKIEVNRKINENLELQAQALFKSWFVDFEPFKNGEFVESELGMIPKGWRVVELTSFGRIVCGKTPSKTESSYYGGNIPFIKIPDMHNKVFVELSEDNLSQMGDESQPAKRIPPYSILVSCIATVGLVCINTQESHTNQQINTIIPNLPIFRYYLY
jgi:type I restriction enzyme S subunit